MEQFSYFGHKTQTAIFCHPTKSLPQTAHTATFLHPWLPIK